MPELDINYVIITIIFILNNLEGPAIYKLCFSVGPSISIQTLLSLYIFIYVINFNCINEKMYVYIQYVLSLLCSWMELKIK